MVLEGLLNIAKGGMNTQVRSFERAAEVIANPYGHPEIDMADALLEGETAVLGFKANVAAYETGLDIWEMLRLSNPDE